MVVFSLILKMGADNRKEPIHRHFETNKYQFSGQPGFDGLGGDIGEPGELFTYCECPQRSPNLGPEQTVNKVVSYYPYYRIL
jgi:hypothetical protein